MRAQTEAPPAPAPATFIQPTDGSAFDPNQPIRWTTQPGALTYYLYVGTAPGLNDIVNSYETQATLFTARQLPAGQTLYARIYTKYSGGWVDSSVQFTVDPVAMFTAPSPNSATISPDQRFEWTSVADAEAYVLDIGSSPGLHDYSTSGEIQSNAFVAVGLPAGRTVYARLSTKHDGTWRQVDRTFEVNPVATFITPLDNDQFADPSVPLRWRPVEGAQKYYLYVGTAPGLKDLVDSYETQNTSWPATSIPPGKTVYARLFTRFGNAWRFVGISFRLAPQAALTTPVNTGATISPNQRFAWTSVADAEAYVLDIGSAPGLQDYLTSGEIHSNFFDASGLPAGRTIYVRLSTKYDGQWRQVDQVFQVTPVATFISPLDNDQNADPGVPIRWRAVEGAQSYYLYVGTAPGLKDLVDSYETQNTSWPATFIPVGQTVFARLYTRQGGKWRYVDTTFRLAPKAVFIDPGADNMEVDPRVPLMWTDVPASQAYYLYVGSQPGAKDLIDSGELTTSSFDISLLPRGQTLYATLYTRWGGAWRFVQRSFHLLPVATLLPRADAPSQIDTRYPLRWVPVEGAVAYYLFVGSTPGAKDLIDSHEIQDTQFPIQGLPPGATIYVRLWTRSGGAWRYADTTLKTRAIAYLTGPAASGGTWSAGAPLSWSAPPGATKYYIYVGSGPGLMDIASSGEIYDTEFQMPEASRPTTDRTVYVRLFSFVDGHWQYVDYALTYRAAAQLVFPRDGDMDADVVALPLEWTEVEAAENYRLQLGTSPGENNVLDTGDVQRHTFRSAVLPGGVTIYARTWTEVGGEWRHSDASFTTRPAAALLHPHYGQLSVDTSQPIDWTSIPDAEAYRLELGSTPGAHDLLDSGSLAATSIDASAALASAPPVIYARIWTRYAETWEFSDAIFETVSNPDAASMDWISDKSAFVASDAFRWTEVPLAASYRLRVGTTRGSSDIHDSGSVRTARRLVADLPAGIPLYGSLDTEYFDGSVSTQEFEFTVADATIGFEARWKHAQWAAAKVRSMATWNNVPLQNTLLLDAARRTLREWTATCSTYTLALLDLLENSNITPYARRLDVCLNRNGFDCHTLVEVLDVDSGRWLILDPTFALVARRTIDNEWATALDIFAATRDKNFAAIEYVPLTSDGLALAEGYYLDYPLLYAHVLAPGTYSNPVASVDSTISYYDLLGTSSVAQSGNYAIVCTAGNNSAQIRVSGSGSVDDDDSVVTVPCDSDAEGLSHVFQTTSIEAAGDPASYEIAVPKRFVFN